MELVVGSEKFYILEEWVGRWQFLKDYRSEMGNSVQWTFTDKSTVVMWMQLNQNMNYYCAVTGGVRLLSNQESENVERSHSIPINKSGVRYDPLFSTDEENLREGSHLPWSGGRNRPLVPGPGQKVGDALPVQTIPLSSLYGMIEYMNPTSSRYLLYVEIDLLLSFNRRKTAYRQLGEYVVKANLTPWGREYIGDKSEDREWNTIRLVFSAFLSSHFYAPPTGLTEIQLLELRRIQTIIRKDPLIDLFGILRSCAQSHGTAAYMKVNWEDVKTIVFSLGALAAHGEVMKAHQSNALVPTDHIDVYKRRFFQESRGFPSLLGDAPASLLFMAKVPLPSIRSLDQLDPMLDSNIQIDKNITLDQVVDMAEFQASNCDPVQLARVAGRMLGMELVLIQKNVGPSTPFWNRPGVYNLLNWKVLDVLTRHGLRHPAVKNYPKVCKALAEDIGIPFLSACAEALLRLTEYWDSRPEELVGTDLIYGSGEREEKTQRKRILSLIEAILPLIEE